MDYDSFVTVTVLTCMVWMERVDIKKKVGPSLERIRDDSRLELTRPRSSQIINSPEIRQVFPTQPILEEFTTSLYNCEYAKFFKSLAAVETTFLLPSRILAPHARYYVREMRIRSYAQLLESYRSLTLESMCRAFGVGPEFMDK
jgi:26S proteasome regulatory subunit N7